MPSNEQFSGNDAATAMLALGIDIAILLAALAIKRDMDFVGFAFAGIILGWMLGITLLKTYRTRKPKKKLFLFLLVHLLPIPLALSLAHI